jgi:hypothetical protein
MHARLAYWAFFPLGKHAPPAQVIEIIGFHKLLISKGKMRASEIGTQRA